MGKYDEYYNDLNANNIMPSFCPYCGYGYIVTQVSKNYVCPKCKKIFFIDNNKERDLSVDYYKNEVWYDIPGYAGKYIISNYMRIKGGVKVFL